MGDSLWALGTKRIRPLYAVGTEFADSESGSENEDDVAAALNADTLTSVGALNVEHDSARPAVSHLFLKLIIPVIVQT